MTTNTNALPHSDLAVRYDRAAQGWHTRLERLGFPGAYRAALGELEPLSHEAQVLDAGVGTGALSLALAAHTPDLHVTGVDLSHAMLAEATKRFAAADVRAQLFQGDVRALRCASRSYDAVLCAHVLEHLADPEVALREFHRVLKPGGAFFLSITRQNMLGNLIANRWGIRSYRADEVKRLVERAGFGEIRFIKLRGLFVQHMSVAVVAVKGTP